MLINNAYVYKDNVNMENINGYLAQQVSNDVWAIDEFGIALAYLIIGSEKALLIDTGIGLGHLDEAVKRLTSLPVMVVNSHHHYDHTGGNGNFSLIYCHKNAVSQIIKENTADYRRYFFESQAKRREYRPCPTFEEDMKRLSSFELIPIEEGYVFDLGDRKLETIETPGHTADSICLLDRDNRLLFTMDTLCSTPTLLYDYYSVHLRIYENSLKKLMDMESSYELIFPGHYLRPIGKIYLEDMVSAVGEILSGRNTGTIHTVSDAGYEGYYYRHNRASFIYGKRLVE